MIHARATLPENETERLKELYGYHILDTLPEPGYDDITYLASQISGCPIALVSLVDHDRQWFKSKIGLEASETSRELAFCAHAINEPTELLIVPDASRDQRFATNPLVQSEPSIRFYAGAPLVTSQGNALGTLCVIDRQPRELQPDQQRALRALSRLVMAQLELRKAVAQLERHVEERHHYQQQLEDYQRKLEESNLLLAQLSRTDALTGLNNRRALLERLEEETRRADRYSQSLSLVLLDIDRFKAYNDSFGHPAGDRVLRQVAELLEREKRQTDFVARYGGEEFAIVLGNTGREGATVLAERFRCTIESATWVNRPVTVSIGVATLAAGIGDVSALISAADTALYVAKEAGRNRISVAD